MSLTTPNLPPNSQTPATSQNPMKDRTVNTPQNATRNVLAATPTTTIN
jgi:hypothetical protein